MNYLKHYIKLIRNAQERKLKTNEYKEKHHVFPKSCFGDNEYLVELTAKEHFIAHLLLWKGFGKRYGNKHDFYIKMASTVFFMKNTNKSLKINSNIYAEAKQKASIHNINKWKDPEFRDKMLTNRLKRKWINNGTVNKWIKPEELDHYISKGWKVGRLISDKHMKKMCKERERKMKLKMWVYKDKEEKLILKSEQDIFISEGWKKGRMPFSRKTLEKLQNRKSSTKGKIKIRKTGENDRLIKKEKLSYYKSKGWEKGSSQRMCGINNGTVNKWIKPEELDHYISKGWTRGWKKQANRRKH